MVCIRSRTCSQQGCKRKPTQGLVGSSKAEFCREHETGGMVTVVEFKMRGCIHPGCTKRPSFGARDTKNNKPEYCTVHKKEGMVNVYTSAKGCAHPGCSKRPSYGAAGSGVKVVCPEHAADDMVPIGTVTCGHSGCTTSPSYGVEGTKKARFCKRHSPPDTVNVVSKRCDHPWGCTAIAAFGGRETGNKKNCRRHVGGAMTSQNGSVSTRRFSSEDTQDKDRQECGGPESSLGPCGTSEKLTFRSPWPAQAEMSPGRSGEEIKNQAFRPTIPVPTGPPKLGVEGSCSSVGTGPLLESILGADPPTIKSEALAPHAEERPEYEGGSRISSLGIWVVVLITAASSRSNRGCSGESDRLKGQGLPPSAPRT